MRTVTLTRNDWPSRKPWPKPNRGPSDDSPGMGGLEGPPRGHGNRPLVCCHAGEERLRSTSYTQINGLACFTLRGQARSTDVRLNAADGFQTATVCQCDLVYF